MASLVLAGCVRHQPRQAPVEPHRPEPVAPPMTPVVMPPITMPMPGTRDSLRFIMDSVLASPMWQNARWGVLIVDPERADTILSYDADRLFMPASNQKLLTAAIALETLGPDYYWRTPFLLDGRQRGSVFNGNLLIAGSGDPSISDTLRNGRASNAFDSVISALKSRGIKRISGRVLPTGDAFPGSTTGYGWSYDDFDASYSAAVDELMFNEGELYLTVSAGPRVGSPVKVSTAPTSSYPKIRVEATTIAAPLVGSAGNNSRPSSGDQSARQLSPTPSPPPLRVQYDSTGLVLTVTGSLVIGESKQLTIAYRHPADAFVAALSEALRSNGIAVDGKALAQQTTSLSKGNRNAGSSAAANTIDTLAVISSAPFPDVLTRMMKPSQNQIAELVFRTSGLVASGSGSQDSARAVGTRALNNWGIPSTDIAYRDGSGLSRHDYLTPRAVVRVLDVMRTSPWFTTFRDALPVAGVDGTLKNRMKGTPAQGVVHAKTGTLDKARSLSGYVTSSDGRLIMFSLLCNNFTVPTREVERVQDLMVAIIAGGTFPRIQ